MGIEDYIARIVNGVWLWSGDMAPNGLVIDEEFLFLKFLTQNFRPVMFSLYREAAEASADLFSVSNRDEISGNREIKGVRSHQTNLIAYMTITMDKEENSCV